MAAESVLWSLGLQAVGLVTSALWAQARGADVARRLGGRVLRRRIGRSLNETISAAKVGLGMNVQRGLSAVIADGLRIEVSVQGAMATIALRGEWDLAAQPEVRRAIGDVLGGTPERLLLDLSGLSFMDASGLNGTRELAQRAAAMNVRLAIVPGPPAVQRVFEVGQVNELPWVDQ